ncbi:hypothetical protein DM02DRAFT_657132 [Periconia macrospinosa]|uniref:Uncharacterized protein n=1 Tax=Periconia macrospinosa TaxID=97972 RepID=A0A2V1DKL4_9PLEO|nr:hypothetical protein DM02DRAFT_657132 [Periconia macrospinosa]
MTTAPETTYMVTPILKCKVPPVLIKDTAPFAVLRVPVVISVDEQTQSTPSMPPSKRSINIPVTLSLLAFARCNTPGLTLSYNHCHVGTPEIEENEEEEETEEVLENWPPTEIQTMSTGGNEGVLAFPTLHPSPLQETQPPTPQFGTLITRPLENKDYSLTPMAHQPRGNNSLELMYEPLLSASTLSELSNLAHELQTVLAMWRCCNGAQFYFFSQYVVNIGDTGNKKDMVRAWCEIFTHLAVSTADNIPHFQHSLLEAIARLPETEFRGIRADLENMTFRDIFRSILKISAAISKHREICRGCPDLLSIILTPANLPNNCWVLAPRIDNHQTTNIIANDPALSPPSPSTAPPWTPILSTPSPWTPIASPPSVSLPQPSSSPPPPSPSTPSPSIPSPSQRRHMEHNKYRVIIEQDATENNNSEVTGNTTPNTLDFINIACSNYVLMHSMPLATNIRGSGWIPPLDTGSESVPQRHCNIS